MRAFADRVDAGVQLASRLEHLRGVAAVVLGLPRGGVPVAAEVARALDLPLDVIVVRKLGVPFQPELAMGALGEDGIRLLNPHVIERGRITEAQIHDVERHERATLEERVERFRHGQPRLDLHGKVAIIVDDGIATGATARVACRVARHLGAKRIVLAVPVLPAESLDDLATAHEADEVVHVRAPRGFRAVGAYYADFTPTTDDEVSGLLERARNRSPADAGPSGHHSDHDPGATTAKGDLAACEDVVIRAGVAAIEGHLTVPGGAKGIVVFAHGSGSSRHSPRNRYVAQVLQEAGLGTLLIDLLTPDEERDRRNVFDIELLAGRLVAATRWLAAQPGTRTCRYGYFGASTGAAAALWAATEPDGHVSAVVSRGGRPDLAGARLPEVRTPTLLIVGSADDVVVDLNRQAQEQLTECECRLILIPGATHLFEEPGTLAEAAGHAQDWFVAHLLRDEPAPGEHA